MFNNCLNGLRVRTLFIAVLIELSEQLVFCMKVQTLDEVFGAVFVSFSPR